MTDPGFVVEAAVWIDDEDNREYATERIGAR